MRTIVYSIELIKLLAYVIDFLFIPIALFYERRGYNVFEAKTSSFGHHLFEPVAVAVLNDIKPKNKLKTAISINVKRDGGF